VCGLIGSAVCFSYQRTFQPISDFIITGEGKPIRRGKQSDKKSALSLNIPLVNPSDALHKRSEIQVSSLFPFRKISSER
jgi:hypothetical protein